MPLFLNSHAPLAAALWLATAFGLAAQPSPSEHEPKSFEVPSGDIFGFTTPTDVGSPGDKDIALETTTRFGKRGGTYWTPTLKTQMGGTIAKQRVGGAFSLRDRPPDSFRPRPG